MRRQTVALLLLATACGGPSHPAVLAAPPVVGVSPPLTGRPAGTVVDLHVGTPEGIAFDPERQSVVFAARPHLLLETDASGKTVRRVELAGSARHVRLAGQTALVPLEDASALALVDLAHGTVRDVATAAAPHDATALGNGTALVASESGRASIVDLATARVTRTEACGVQPATVVADGDLSACVDVRGQGLYRYPDGKHVLIGKGPTHVVDLGGGQVAVADALGDAVDVVDLATLKTVRHVDLDASPEGLAADEVRHRLWVTTPSENNLVEIDLRTGSLTTRPVVRQANSLAVDPATGTVFVLGATPDGQLEILPS